MIKKAKRRKSSKPPRPDKLPGPIKYKAPLKDRTSAMEIAWSPEMQPKKRR
jgi:hypothetical protein